MNERILIVEDDPDASQLYLELLAADGYAVDLARDGMEALFRAKATRPDVVVLDIGLPRLDGIYLADLWKHDPPMAGVPLIAISAFFDAHNLARAKQAGCAVMLPKPFTPDVLRAAIRQVLQAPATGQPR